MAHIFISYSHKDNNYVRALREQLQARHMPVWIDQRIRVGDAWAQAIVKAIRDSHAVIVIVSPESVQSTWVQREILLAQRERKPIFPLLVSGEEMDLLIDVQHINLREYQAPEETFFARLAEYFPQPTQPPIIPPSDTIPAVPPDAPEGDVLRDLLIDVLGPLDQSYYFNGEFFGHDPKLDEIGDEETRLQIIFKRIFLARLCVFDLSRAEMDAYLEMGIALALNRPILALAQNDARIADLLDGYNILRYRDAEDLFARLSEQVQQENFLQATGVKEYCQFCDQICYTMNTEQDPDMYLLLDSSRMIWREMVNELTAHIGERNLYPVRLTEPPKRPKLCDLRMKTLRSQFAVGHMGRLASQNTLLALGMAIGSLMPWALFYDPNSDVPPADLLDNRHTTPANSANERLDEIDKLLNLIMLPNMTKEQRAAARTLKLVNETTWAELDDWVKSVTHRSQTHEQILGDALIIRYEGKKYLGKNFVHPTRGLRVGRDPARCDVILEHPLASADHFLITKEGGEYFIEDQNSTNGTFMNGDRLKPRRKRQIFFKDSIRVAGAHFLVWDERPLPDVGRLGNTSQLGARTGPLRGQVFSLEFDDIPPPVELDTWDHKVSLEAVIAGGNRTITFEAQAYYPFERILPALSVLLKLPKMKHHFRHEGKLIAPEDTPLDLRLKEGDKLEIIVDAMEWMLKELPERIVSCDSARCQPIDHDTREIIWTYGKKFGTIRRLFDTIYRKQFDSDPPSDLPMPKLLCPRCKSPINEKTILGVDEA
ncbi:MAG: TIR domain-containing protein [Anaerolineae bacterium]|nr:TIR domain-containing protein [Anaerolineae bacterium]